MMAGALLAMAACSPPRPEPAVTEVRRDPNTLTLLAEVALERGDCRAASEDYAAAALQSPAAIAHRASDVGLGCDNLPSAWQAVQRWRTLAPTDVDAATTYAAVAIKLYKIAPAVAAAKTVVQAGGSNPDARIGQLASTLLEEAEAPAVLAVMSSAVGEKSSPEVLVLLAQLSLQAYDPERAEHYAHQALGAEPGLKAAKQILARVYVMRGDASQAIATATEVMTSDPKNDQFELADILVALDHREEARAELERLRTVKAAPANEIDQRLALLAFQEGDLPEAQRRFSGLAAHGDVGEGVILYLADIAARQGDTAAALAGYRQLENSQLAVTARTAILLPDNRAAAFALLDDYTVAHPEQGFELTLTKVHLLSEQGEMDAGLALLQAALERHPDHPALEYERAVLLERSGAVKESIEALDHLLSERPDDPTLLNALGYTLADHNEQLPRAEKLIRRALISSPDNPAVLDSLGWVRFRRGDARGATPPLEHAYTISQDGDIAAHLGEVLWHRGEESQARKLWAAALARDPDSALVKSTMTRLLPQPQP